MADANRADPLARARELTAVIAEAADQAERQHRLPQALVDRLHESRLFRLFYPRSVGGEETEPGSYVLAVEELARADGSVGWCVSIANSTGLFAPYLSLDAARRVFGPPHSICAWGPPNDCRGVAVPGGYRISGRWDFASGCRHASWIGAHGAVVEPDGTLRSNRHGRSAIQTWLFPVEKATLLDNWTRLGCAAPAPKATCQGSVRPRATDRHPRGSDTAARTRRSLRLSAADALLGRHRQRRTRHRPRHG
jgi:indole-3-acetate monooxygenase